MLQNSFMSALTRNISGRLVSISSLYSPMSTLQRALGQDGPRISSIGLGFGSLSGFYGPPGTIDERLDLLDHAYSSGLHFWDLADIYGDSEDLAGKWFNRSGKRDNVFLATKFGLQQEPNGLHRFRSDPQYVRDACERSLERLGVDTIDLYYCHRVDGVTPIEKTVQAMVELKKEGKIRHLGLSDVSEATLRRAYAIHPIAAVQIEYSLFTLDAETTGSNILETCKELGVAIVAFSPIGRGILTGQFKSHADIPEGDLRRKYPKYAEGNFSEILRLVRKLEEVANSHGSTTAQVALAWLLAQGPHIFPIPGTKSPNRMEENITSTKLQLKDSELQELRAIAESLTIEGTRYPAARMATLSKDTPPLNQSK